ncbi:MAG: hypothetical protein M3065_17620 [Actinomycetota bacterium]|nr:hypothetical protein [Actinomycetota bacterium]
MTFTDNHYGTAALAGTPARNTGGAYGFGTNANHGVSPAANQSFTLTVDQPPGLLGPSPMAFTVGKTALYQVKAQAPPIRRSRYPARSRAG